MSAHIRKISNLREAIKKTIILGNQFPSNKTNKKITTTTENNAHLKIVPYRINKTNEISFGIHEKYQAARRASQNSLI